MKHQSFLETMLDTIILSALISTTAIGIIGVGILLVANPLLGLPVACITGFIICNILIAYGVF